MYSSSWSNAVHIFSWSRHNVRGSAPTGLQQRLVRDSKLSDKIFMFDLKFETWSEVVYSRQTTADRYRYILPYQNTIKCK